MIPKIRNILFSVLFILLSITIIGVFWLVTTPSAHVSLVFAYAAGMSMIFLPCTLPLVFVIVPLAMKKSPLKAVTMAVLFGLGLAITLSIYGALVAGVGNYIGMNKKGKFGTIVSILLIVLITACTPQEKSVEQMQEYTLENGSIFQMTATSAKWKPE